MTTTKTMLSKHFSADELRCPATGICQMEASLLIALEEFRELVGKPLKVLSGYRDPSHNAEVGGAERSQHTFGRAVDIALPKDLSITAAYRLAEQVDGFRNGGIGLYPDEKFIHLDTRGKKARWARVGGKYVGIEVVLSALKQKGKA